MKLVTAIIQPDRLDEVREAAGLQVMDVRWKRNSIVVRHLRLI